MRHTNQRGRGAIWLAAALFLCSQVSGAQQEPPTRITTIDNSVRVTISVTPPMARPANDVGVVPGSMSLSGISLVFRRSSGQETQLQVLISAQQDPASAMYHNWLTPEQFAGAFGMAQSDIAKVSAWLSQQGFSVDGVSHSKNRIYFSGTVGQVNQVFDTELHYYNVNGVKQYAPSKNITVPAALASVTEMIANLSSFRPKPHVRFRK
jgi:subtilase family serine protease